MTIFSYAEFVKRNFHHKSLSTTW